MVPVAWCSTEAALLSRHECRLSQVGTRPSTRLVPQLWSTASYLTGLLVSSSGAIIVTVLWPVPFPKCASSTYKGTQTSHTLSQVGARLDDLRCCQVVKQQQTSEQKLCTAWTWQGQSSLVQYEICFAFFYLRLQYQNKHNKESNVSVTSGFY